MKKSFVHTPHRQAFLGIDSGSTKTAGVLVSSDGRVLASRLAPPSSIFGKPSRKAICVVRALIKGLLGDAGLDRSAVAHTGIGMSGIDFGWETPMQKRVLSRELGIPARDLTLVNDGMVALWGASPEPAVILIQHGTGYTAAWRSRIGRERLFDHLAVGGPFDLRYALLTHVARMIDGREPDSPLRRATLRHYGIKSADKYGEAAFFGRIPDKKVVTTVPLIFRRWTAGDASARVLVRRAAEDYTVAILAMARHIPKGRLVVCLGGGILNRAPDRFIRLVATLVARRRPGIVMSRPILPPAHGAAVMAAFHAGLNPEDFFTPHSR